MDNANVTSRWSFPAVCVLLLVIWFFFPKRAGVFPLDDAYIHLSYVRNLVATGTFCLNPGEPSMGTSSPLWVVLLALFQLLKIDLYWAVQIISLVLFGLLCIMSMDTVKTAALRLGFSTSEADIYSVLTGLLLILNGNLHWFAWSGMETMMFLCLCFFSIKLYSRRGFDYITGAFCGLVFLTRAPGALLVAVLILFELFKRRLSTLWRGVIALALIISPYLFLSMKITGGILPTTVRGKLVTYVDGGFNWGGIEKSQIQNEYLIRQLLKEKVIRVDKDKPNHIFFNDDIRNEEDLRTRLKRIGSVDIEQFVGWWQWSGKNRILWFIRALFSYQQYLPHNYLFLAIILANSFIIAGKYRSRMGEFKSAVLDKYLECSVLIVWGLAHLVLYTVKFRILLHNSRYFANEFVIGTILGSLGLLILFRHRPKIEGRFLGTAALIMAASSLFFWREVFANNIRHIDEVYINMGKWINKNTPPDARIASFDIGVLRYTGDRYTVDLGGLVDPEVHSCLEVKECGEYVRKERADYILYPRNLDVDVFTGIHLAEYRGPMLLKQIPVVHYEVPQFETPVLIQAFRMELRRIIGWYPNTPAGILQAFSYDGRPYNRIGRMIDDRLEFVGYSIDQRSVEYIPFYPYTIDFTFFYRAVKPLEHIYWFHTVFFDPQTGDVLYQTSHIPTNNLLEFDKWPVNRLIQSHHLYFVPYNFKRQKYKIKLAVTLNQSLDDPEKLSWTDLGEFENKGNILNPVDHQQMMALSTN